MGSAAFLLFDFSFFLRRDDDVFLLLFLSFWTLLSPSRSLFVRLFPMIRLLLLSFSLSSHLLIHLSLYALSSSSASDSHSSTCFFMTSFLSLFLPLPVSERVRKLFSLDFIRRPLSAILTRKSFFERAPSGKDKTRQL